MHSSCRPSKQARRLSAGQWVLQLLLMLQEDTKVADCNVLCMLHLPQQHCIAAGCEDGVIHMHYAEGHGPVATNDGGPVPLVLIGHDGKVTGLVALPNDFMLSCSDDKSLRVWNLKTLKQVHVSTNKQRVLLLSLASRGPGQQLAVKSNANSVNRQSSTAGSSM